MNRLCTAAIAALLVAGCASAPAPIPGEKDVPTAEQTAKIAGDATRKAEKTDNTGVIYASSAEETPAESKEPAKAEKPATPKPSAAETAGRAVGESVHDVATSLASPPGETSDAP